jgi:hypothetical protein
VRRSRTLWPTFPRELSQRAQWAPTGRIPRVRFAQRPDLRPICGCPEKREVADNGRIPPSTVSLPQPARVVCTSADARAHTVLEARLRKYKNEPRKLDPSEPGRPVGCGKSLLSWVDTPVERSSFKGEDVYLIWWQTVWMPPRKVNDLNHAYTGRISLYHSNPHYQGSTVVLHPLPQESKNENLLVIALSSLRVPKGI